MIFRRRDSDGFEGASFWRILTTPFRAITRSISEVLERDDAMHVERSITSRVVGLLTFPFRLFWGFLVFMVHAWAQSRPGFAFLKGAPAILVTFLFFVMFLFADWYLTEGKRIRSTKGYLAFQVKNSPDHPEYAMIFAEKLVELKPDDPAHIFELGLAYDRVDNMVKALDTMSSIAYDDHAGFPMGHVWRSQYYLSSDLNDLDQEQRESLARKHLGFAVEVAPDNQAANFDLGQLYLRQSVRHEKGSLEYKAALDEAIKFLTTVAEGEVTKFRLIAVPKLAELEMEVGNSQVARRRLSNEITMLESIARKQPEIFEVWQAMVKNAILLKDYNQAARVVRNGLDVVEDLAVKRRIYQMGAQVFVEKCNDFQDMSDREQYRNRINSLCDAVRLDQSNRGVYLRLLDFIGTKDPAENSALPNADGGPVTDPNSNRLDFSESNDAWLNDSIVGNRVPGVIHALIGMREISKGNIREGEKHWRMAEQQFNRTQFVVNNLIDIAANDRPDEFTNVLDMITLGIELFPDQPVFYQTRGVYLLNQGKIDEAITDFKYAGEKMPEMFSIQKYLIKAYKLLGDHEKAMEHQDLLNQNLSQLNASERRMVEAAIGRIE